MTVLVTPDVPSHLQIVPSHFVVGNKLAALVQERLNIETATVFPENEKNWKFCRPLGNRLCRNANKRY